MKRNISYYFSKEYKDIKQKEKFSKIQELLDSINKEYKQKGTIHYMAHNREALKHEKTIAFAGIAIWIVIFLGIMFVVGYNMMKYSQMKINPFIYVIVFFIIILMIIDHKNTKCIDTIILSDNNLMIQLLDWKYQTENETVKKYTYKLQDIILTTRINRSYDEAISYDYLITIKNRKQKQNFYLDATGKEDEFLAYIIYLKSLIYNIDIENISDEELKILYLNTFNGNIGLKTINRSNIQLFLIGSIVSLVLFVLIFGQLCLRYVKTKNYVGIPATISDVGKVNFYNSGEHIQYNYINYTYEYNGNLYNKQKIVTFTLGKRVGQSMKLYIDPNDPYEVKEEEISEITMSILFGMATILLLREYRNRKKLEVID